MDTGSLGDAFRKLNEAMGVRPPTPFEEMYRRLLDAGVGPWQAYRYLIICLNSGRDYIEWTDHFLSLRAGAAGNRD